MTRRYDACLAGAAALLALPLACSRRHDPVPPGSAAAAGTPAVVVEEVVAGSPAAAAGLQAGDVLAAWERASSPQLPTAASGLLQTPFDLHLVEIREGASAAVTLRGRRGARPLAVTIKPGIWELYARPSRPSGTPVDEAWHQYAAARAAAKERDWDRANTAFAAAVRAAEGGDVSVLAFLEREAGFAMGRQARLAESRRWHERALRHRERAHGLERAGSLYDLAIVAFLLNELDPAAALADKARAVVEQEAPRSHVFASVLGLQGILQEKRGDLAAHERLGARAVALLEELDPAGRFTAASLHNMGDVLRRRGHFARAEEFYRRSLAIKARFPPDRHRAYTLLSLGHVERARGYLAAARKSYESALDLVRAHGPDATAEAALHVALGETALESGDEKAAGDHFAAALATYRKVAPRGSGVTETLGRLGEVARRAGRYDEARNRHREALALAEQAAPRGLETARALFHLGEVSLDERQARAAEPLLRRALSLHERAAPDTAAHAEVLHRLALVVWRGGRAAEAEPMLARATAILDALQGRLGGTEEAAARFHARYLRIYRDQMDLLLALGRPEAAFEALERSRAVALRRILRQRDLDLGRSPDRPGRHAAALGEAPPVSAAEASAALEAGTAVLSFAVGPESTRVFVLESSAPVRVVTLDAGEEDLRGDVERLRLLLAAPGPGVEAREGLLLRAEGLYRRLLRPLEPHVGGAARLLVVPDGPLHLLPFAALVRLDENGHRRYLAEWKPHHTAASLTAYVLLARNGGSSATPRGLLAFGDPAPSAATHRLGALPASRSEVEAVAAQFHSSSRAFVGGSATEERVKALAPQAGVLHLAVHGIVDDVLPMDSGLVLAAGGAQGADDGFLQAWEIVQGIRLDADLVTLSGCDTALGAPVPGEGIVGLAGAFQYAGARAVLASLWKVSDRSTADLMQRFYRRLAHGRPAAAALREARVELMSGPVVHAAPAAYSRWTSFWRGGTAAAPADVSHPFHWAAFELMGAPR